MISIIDNKYYQSERVQLMLPISCNCIFFGPEGEKFQCSYGEVLIDDYINDPKRKLFPFCDSPMHEDDKGVFVNQLFELNRQYLEVWFDGKDYQFRSDSFFQEDETIYNYFDTELEMETQKIQEMSLETLQEKFLTLLQTSTFLSIIDDNGEFHKYQKNLVECDIPLSGVGVFGNGDTLNAFIYELKISNEQVSIKTQKLKFKERSQESLENCSHTPEPVINKR